MGGAAGTTRGLLWPEGLNDHRARGRRVTGSQLVRGADRISCTSGDKQGWGEGCERLCGVCVDHRDTYSPRRRPPGLPLRRGLGRPRTLQGLVASTTDIHFLAAVEAEGPRRGAVQLGFC